MANDNNALFIFISILCVGGVLMLVGLLLLLLSVFTERLFVQRISNIALQNGLFIFLFGIAAIVIVYAIEGLQNGAHKIKLGRVGSGTTTISSESQPVLFVLYTLFLFGFAGWLTFFLIRNVIKRLKRPKI